MSPPVESVLNLLPLRLHRESRKLRRNRGWNTCCDSRERSTAELAVLPVSWFSPREPGDVAGVDFQGGPGIVRVGRLRRDDLDRRLQWQKETTVNSPTRALCAGCISSFAWRMLLPPRSLIRRNGPQVRSGASATAWRQRPRIDGHAGVVIRIDCPHVRRRHARQPHLGLDLRYFASAAIPRTSRISASRPIKPMPQPIPSIPFIIGGLLQNSSEHQHLAGYPCGLDEFVHGTAGRSR